MSGGARDDAVLAIAHFDKAAGKTVLDLVISQTGSPPFSAPAAVRKFAAILKQWGISKVRGDAYAGDTFGALFLECGIVFERTSRDKSTLYESLEPVLMAQVCELLDVAKLTEQLLTLIVTRSGKVDHQTGDHDDYANAVAGAIWFARPHQVRTTFARPLVVVDGQDVAAMPATRVVTVDAKRAALLAKPVPPHYLKTDDGYGYAVGGTIPLPYSATMTYSIA
jgi:hypothetical protein